MSSAEENGDGKLDGRKVVEMLGELQPLKLPEGWIGVNHYSGGIIYLHKKTRVVTWSRPYSIGDISLRKHDVPAAAIPCLHQFLRLMEMQREMKTMDEYDGPPLKKVRRIDEGGQDLQNMIENKGEGATNVSLESDIDKTDIDKTADHIIQNLQDGGFSNSAAKQNNAKACISTAGKWHWCNARYPRCPIKSFENENIELISPDQLSKYLSSIFKFDKLTEEESHKPIFGEGSREEPKIELPDVLKALPFSAFSKGQEKDSFIHKPGNTHLSMLNEYCNKNIMKPIEWIDSICDDNQFAVEAVIEGVKYGRGKAKSKKGAKQLAAKNTLEILIPEQMAVISNFSIGEKELAVFDSLDIDDPTVSDCANSVGLPLPADVLSKCLKRNQAVCDTNIYFKLTPNESNDLHTYEIVCGKHSAMGSCKNRRTGKQLASQAVLKKIHPKLEKWGQLIRLYCSSPTSLIRESKSIKAHGEFLKLPEERSELMMTLHREMRELEKKQGMYHRRTDLSSSIASAKSKIFGKEVDL